MLTVACVFVVGEYPYTADYVTRLHAMVTRWIDRPFRFVCLTDQPWLFQPPIDTVPVAKLAGFAPWTKLELFNPVRQWPGRVLYLDLDSLIVAPLADIIDQDTEFAITADPTNKRNKMADSFGRQIIRRFNSSVMVWDGGTQTQLYTRWNSAVSARLSGDQDYLAEQIPHADTMPRSWFPRLSEIECPPFPVEAKVILSKRPKNDVAALKYPWFLDYWGEKRTA